VPKKKQDEISVYTSSIPKVQAEKANRSPRISWAKLLARVFQIDLENCPNCPGELKIIAPIVEREAIRKILNHRGLPDEPPDISPADTLWI